ncbi:hypothetical protein P5G65_03875 [Paenibacillus chondroitinus]|uniref:Uncharacterized protein n=1 Tax=Paenibacillus chondroitinus TaxID=59842 RepID=A0ABU6D5J8_9BACL|nr:MULTISPECIES: hypothetical protein [Paenibacillus]MCY9660121.1 hypothetical protein [Paenibacillus anseongense]MEB4793020.1 hypothetical protein [Paenibacillus chondroitinus]
MRGERAERYGYSVRGVHAERYGYLVRGDHAEHYGYSVRGERAERYGYSVRGGQAERLVTWCEADRLSDWLLGARRSCRAPWSLGTSRTG